MGEQDQRDPWDPDLLVGGAAEREKRWSHRGRSRWRVVVAAVSVAAAVAVLAPRLSLHADAPPGVPSADRSLRSPASTDGAARHWPLRGDLAGDDAFVASGLRRLGARPSDAASQTLFAGHLPDGSRLLLARARDDAGALASVRALHVARGRAVGEGTVSAVTELTDPAQSLGWATIGPSGTVYVLALGAPRPLQVQLSPRVAFTRAARPTRSWLTASSDDGVVLADLGTRVDPSVAVRSLGLSSYVVPTLIPVTGRSRTLPRDVVVTGATDAAYVGPSPKALRAGLFSLTDALLDLGATEQHVLWSGVPWARRHFALVLITRSDGARFQALVGEQNGGWFPAGLRALRDPEPDELPWVLEPFTAEDPTLLLCPSGGGTLVYRRGARTTRLRIRDDGVVSLVDPAPSPPSVGGAHITVLGSDGERLLRAVLPETGFADALALQP